jgi:threonine synthase
MSYLSGHGLPFTTASIHQSRNRAHIDPEVFVGRKRMLAFDELQSVLTDKETIIQLDGMYTHCWFYVHA